jgi:hypothetical protein
MAHHHVLRAILGSALLAVPVPSPASDVEATGEGYLRFRSAYQSVRADTPLNPNAALFEPSDNVFQAFALLRGEARLRDTGLKVQFRPFYQTDRNATTRNIFVDEAYLEHALSASRFLFAGRRNIVTGVAFSTNPTDFFGDGKQEDFTLPEDERRDLRTGVYMLGADWFFDGGNASLVVAPQLGPEQEEQTRVQLRLGWLLQRWQTDIALQVLAAGERPGFGLNASTTVGGALVLYTESALRRGRDRDLVKQGQVTLGDPDAWLPNVVLGGSYTFANATNLILELHYNGNGYSESEWDSLREAADAAAPALIDPTLRAGAAASLSSLNSLTAATELRKKYLFLRLSQPDLLGRFAGSLFWLDTLDDSGQLVRGRLETTLGDAVRLGVMTDYMDGSSFSEYGMRPRDWSVVLDLQYFF